MPINSDALPKNQSRYAKVAQKPGGLESASEGNARDKAVALNDRAALKRLVKSDPTLKPWIKEIGPIALPQVQEFSLADALARSILFQQLSGKAATTIVGRLELLAAETVFTAKTLATLSEAEFRSVGVSGNKAKALHSLAQHALDGLLPTHAQLSSEDNARIIENLIKVRGIGAWTVQMMLIFRMGRTDIWPIDDLGVRKGVQIAHGLEHMPSPKQLTLWSETRWAPDLTLAALVFWRIADSAKAPGAPKSK